jgi:hypothetical protein
LTINIYAPLIPGAYYFYHCIKCIALLKQTKQEDLKCINLIFLNLPFNIASVGFRKVLKKSILFINKNRSDTHNNLGFYEKFLHKKKSILEIQGLSISIEIIDLSLLKKIKIILHSFITSLYFWLYTKKIVVVNIEKLINMQYRDINIGRAIGSAAIRSNSYAHGSIHKCNIFPSIFGAIYIVNYIKANFNCKSVPSYCIPSERYFLQSLFVQAFRSQGAKILDFTRSNIEFEIVSPDEEFNWFNQVQYYPCSILDRGNYQAKAYMETRIMEPEKGLWYMFRGSNSCDEKIIDNNEKPIFLDDKKLYVILFLHMFEDGQYAFGYDGCDDIYHWTILTMNELIKNKNIETIFIKQHPNMSYSKYPGDKIANDMLLNFFSSNPKVIWLHETCGPYAFKGVQNLIGISKHGSVVEEMAFLRIPSISSVCSRWNNHFDFSKTWNSVPQYIKILQGLSLKDASKLNESQVHSLFKYINLYHLGAKSIQDRQAWVDFANKVYGEKVTPSDLDTYEIKLRNLSENDPNFKRFLSILA